MRVFQRIINIFSDWRESFFLGLANLLPRTHWSDRSRSKFLAWTGATVGKHVTLWSPIEIRPIGGAQRVFLGNNTFINSGVRFACPEPATISIGNHVMVGPQCCFETMNHSLTFQLDGSRPGAALSIMVADYVWIGARVTVLPGVTIGRGSVVAAGAVVIEDVPPFCLVAGTPARVIRSNLQNSLEKSPVTKQ